jgi:integrase-like protein
MTELLLDAAGRRRSPATMPGFHAGRPPRNNGHRYPADPPTVEEIVAVMRAGGDGRHGRRLRGLIVVLWRAGLRIHEALALNESDLDHRRGALLVRRGKGGRRREVGMDEWGCEHLQRWIDLRLELPVGPLFCVINGPTRGRPWSPAAARAELRRVAATAGVRRRFAPHQLRHAHAVGMAHEGVPLIVIQRQLGHSNLGITSIYLQGIDNAEIIDAVHRPPRADGPGQRLARSLTLAATPLVAHCDSGGSPLPDRSSSSDAIAERGWPRSTAYARTGQRDSRAFTSSRCGARGRRGRPSRSPSGAREQSQPETPRADGLTAAARGA